MLRAVRFAGKLGFDIEPKTKDAIKKNKDKIKGMARERIKDELWKMASQSGDKFANTIQILDDVGILEIILPELMKLKDFKENPAFHPEAYEDGKGSPFDHVLKALRKNKLEDPLVNMAILFHDLGKGVTAKREGEYDRFFGHAKEAEALIRQISSRLRLSKKEKSAILFTAINHMKMHNALDMKPTKIMKLVQDDNWEILKAVSYCDDKCRTGLFDKARFKDVIDNMEKINKKWGSKTSDKVAKVIDGNRVMKLTGLRPSKAVGQIIAKVTEIAISNNIKSDKELDKLILQVYGEMK
jgi:tRNA nucleotidyltransferase/poly(A) polymerase